MYLVHIDYLDKRVVFSKETIKNTGFSFII